MSNIDQQKPPAPNNGVTIWDLVIADMHARDHVGRERYGTPLQAHNGRDALIDAYQEALDLVVYLRQAIEERTSETEFEHLRTENAKLLSLVSNTNDNWSSTLNTLQAVRAENAALREALQKATERPNA